MITLRKAAGQVRRVLKDHPCKVTGETVSFEGFGYGSAGFVNVACEEALPTDSWCVLEDLACAYRQAEPKVRIIISLSGRAYPFGGTIK